MKTIITKINVQILAFVAFIFITISCGAQSQTNENTTDITPSSQDVTINVPGIGTCTVAIVKGDFIDVIPKNLRYSNGAALFTGELVTCLTPKPGHPGEFWALVSGQLYLFQAVKVGNFMNLVKLKSRLLFTIGSDGYLQVEGDALYVNDLGIIGVSRDTGATWTVDTLGMGYAGWFKLDTAQNVWALGEFNNFLYYQNKDTNKWHKVITFPAGIAPQKIYIDRKNRFFVSTNNNGVYYSYNQGITWTQGITGLTSVNCGLMCDDYKGNIYMISRDGSKFYRSVNGGATWTEPPGDTAITNHLASTSNPPSLFNCISGDTILAASTQFGMYFSADSGRTWIQNDTGLFECNVNGFWKCKNGRLVETSSNGVFWQDHGNQTWNHPLPADGYGMAGMLFADTLGDLYANGLTANSTAPYMKSADNGTTWLTDTLGIYQVKDLPAWWVDQYGNEHNVNNAYSNGVKVYSKTPGNPYVLDTMGIGIFSGLNYPQVLSFGSDGAGYLYMSGSLSDYANVYRRPILGGKWIADTIGTHKTYFNLFAHDASKTMIASPGFHASGLYYRNAGVWTSIPYPSAVPSYGDVSAIACDSSGGTMAAFYHYDFSSNGNLSDGIYCTHDYGTTWTYDGLDSVYVNQLVNCGGDTTYAITRNAGIFKVVCSGVIVITGTQAANTISEAKQVATIYPNPNNGTFTLHIVTEKLNIENGNCNLKLMDVTGREVKMITLGNSEFTIIRAEGLSNGLYFWEVSSGNKLLDKGKIAVVK